MKTPKQGPKKRPSQAFRDVPYDPGRATHAGSARELPHPPAKTLEKGIEDYYQDLTDPQRIQQQYRTRTDLLQAQHAREVDCTVHRYTVLEMANEASRDHVRHIAEQAQAFLLHHGQAKFVKQKDLQADWYLDEVPTEAYEVYEATVEQSYQDLNSFYLPKLFLGKRLRWVLLAYLLVAALTLNGLYRYQILLPPALYYSLPLVVVVGLMLFALVKHYLWQYTRRELRDMYSHLMGAYESAALLLQQDAERIASRLDQDLSKLQRRHELQSRRLEYAQSAATAHFRGPIA